MHDSNELIPALEDTARTGVQVVGLRLLRYGISFLTSILVVRALGPYGRGLYALPVALLGIVMALSHVGLEHANVFLAGKRVALRSLWVNSTVASFGVALVVWVLVGALYLVAAEELFGGLPATWIVLAVLQVPLLLHTLYWTNLLQLSGHVAAAVKASVVGIAVHAGIAVALFVTGSMTPFRVLALMWAATGTTWFLLLLLSGRSHLVGAPPGWVDLRSALTFGAKAYVGLVFFFLLLRVDQILVQRMLGFEELGLYSIAVTIAELLWLLTDPFAASMLPHQVRAAVGDERRLGYATARMSLVVSATAAVLAWVSAPLAIPLVYGSEFDGSVWAFRLLLPGIVALSIQRPLSTILLKEGRVVVAGSLGLLALSLNIVGNLLLLPRLGIAGASLASTVSYAAMATGCVFATRRTGVSSWGDLLPGKQDLLRLRAAFATGTSAAGEDAK